MRIFGVLLAAVVLVLPAIRQVQAAPVPVEKNANSPTLLMHYMPWFQTPSSLGGTGGSSWGFIGR